MLQILERINPRHHDHPLLTLTLPFDLRQKSRLRAQLDNGTEVGLLLPRGTVLRNGDCLRAEDGSVIAIHAATEAVSTVRAASPLALARACYHLGNRHVALQIGDGWARYQQDHVLDAMVRDMGLQVEHEQTMFEPEGGAYAHSHSHGHQHD